MILDASLNEVETLAAKAARGAGLSWGLAEDAGRAARWLARFGLPWAETLVGLLACPDRDGVEIRPDADGLTLLAAGGAALSPLAAGPALADYADRLLTGRVFARQVRAPLWLLPFGAQASAAIGRPVELRCSGFGAIVSRHRCTLTDGALDHDAHGFADVTCRVPADGAGPGAARVAVGRAPVSMPAWEALEAQAFRTYVPASAASRVLGAGAGGDDND